MRQVTLMRNYLLLACIALISFVVHPAFAAHENNHDGLFVDFAYMPPEWQTAICLPDNPYKSIVDKSGDLLYHYQRIVGGTDGFRTRISLRIADDVLWKKQQLYSPRVPIVLTFLTANELEVTEEAFAVTDKLKSSTPTKPETQPRNDLMLVRAKNTGAAPRVIEPQLIVDTQKHFYFRLSDQQAVLNHHETITASLKMTALSSDIDGQRHVIGLESLTIPAGKTKTFFILYSGGGKIVLEPATVVQAWASHERAVAYWQKVPLPYNRVQVPDPQIQALIDSAIRNIWQAREIKDGPPFRWDRPAIADSG